jgi:hypothetical protein
MRHPNPGLEHQASNASNRDMSTHSVLVDENKRAVKDIKLSTLNEKHRQAFLDRDGTKRGQQLGH